MDPTYFTTPTTAFGPAEWVFFIASIAVALAGAYLAFLRADSNAVRAGALRQLGIGLLGSGIVGIFFGGLRLAGVGVPPFLFTIVTLFYAVIAAYAIYFASTIYPGRLAAQSAARPRGSRSSPVRASSPAARPVGTTTEAAANGVTRIPGSGRRDSRRERKRRGK
jgi:hypothetical protein